MKYYIKNNKNLFIKESVKEKLKKFKQKKGMVENGGILLGKIKEDFSEYVITDISTPSIKDKQGPYNFIRSKEQAQIIINKKWRKSKGVINYLGEWHTHPEVKPTPSIIDIKLLNDCVKNNLMEYRELFMIIVGTEGHFYIGYQNNLMKKMKKLKEY